MFFKLIFRLKFNVLFIHIFLNLNQINHPLFLIYNFLYFKLSIEKKLKKLVK